MRERDGSFNMRKTRTLHPGISHRSVPHVTKRSENGDTLRVAREKIIRVFRYLEALNQHRNPVQRQLSGQQWSFWLHDLPSHPAAQRGPSRIATTARAAKDEVRHRQQSGRELRVQGQASEAES